MFIYAGIDEAGYGPMFGPLTVARFTLCIPNLDGDAGRARPPDLWARLGRAVCRRLSETRGADKPIAVNDSKLLTSKAAGFGHLERGVLTFAATMEDRPQPATAADWLDLIGSTTHHALGPDHLPWYAADADSPWQTLPAAWPADALPIDRGVLKQTCDRIGLHAEDLGCAVVFEDRFNDLVVRAGSKAAVSLRFVTRHLQVLMEQFGDYHPLVVVDRQSGRTRYGDALRAAFPDAELTTTGETAALSAYRIRQGGGALEVRFMPEAETHHMPVALASMTAKYTRELLMQRFKAWWLAQLPAVKPCAGYGTDAVRFTQDIAPHLAGLGLSMSDVRRRA